MNTIFSKLKSFSLKKSTTNEIISVHCDGLVKNVFKPEYGSASKDKLGPMPLISIPLSWSNIPKNTQSFAITVTSSL